jgi:hypothetical protein
MRGQPRVIPRPLAWDSLGQRETGVIFAPYGSDERSGERANIVPRGNIVPWRNIGSNTPGCLHFCLHLGVLGVVGIAICSPSNLEVLVGLRPRTTSYDEIYREFHTTCRDEHTTVLGAWERGTVRSAVAYARH